MNNINDWFDSITLVDSRSLMKNEKCHFFREYFIILTEILHNIKILSLEIDDFGHESIIPHALVFHVIKFISMFNKESHKLEGVLKLSRVIIVTHRVFLLSSCKR